MLGEALYFAGGLGCPLEYLHAGFRPAFAERWSAPDLGTLAAAVRRHRTGPDGTLSIKLFWRDIQDVAAEADPALAEALSQSPATVPVDAYHAAAALVGAMFPNPVITHLRRQDRLRQAVSAMVAVDTGRWRAIPGQTHGPTGPMPALDAERIERLMGYGDFCHDHFTRLFAAMGTAPYPLHYEELTGDYQASVTALLRHLGSDAAPPPARMQRQSDGESEALVIAYLRARGTPVVAPGAA